jgi:hypothetical protein
MASLLPMFAQDNTVQPGAPSTINLSELARTEAARPATAVTPSVAKDSEKRPKKKKTGIQYDLPVPPEVQARPAQVFPEGNGTTSLTSGLENQSANAPAPAVTFPAIIDNNTTIPPDVNGAVGPNHVLTTLNSEYRVQSKTGAITLTVSASSFWAGVGGTNPSPFDPKTFYDPSANRWVLVACANAAAASSSVLIAVSQTNDPSGLWNRYIIDADNTDVNWFDYPSIGFNSQWIVVSGNLFTVAANNFTNNRLWIFDKSLLYAGSATPFVGTQDSPQGFTIVPAQTYDPAQTTLHLITSWNLNSGGNAFLRLFTLTGAVNAPVLTTGNFVSINQPSSFSEVDAPQLGAAQLISTNDTRMHNAVFRNGSLWCTHTAYLPAAAPTRSSIYWWQINPTTAVAQQFGKVDDANVFRAFPSIAVDGNNNMLLGYSQFSTATFASSAYSYRASTDAPNTLQAPFVFKAGEAKYFKTFGGTTNRWGDYTMTMMDPSDPNALWTIQQYAATPGGGFDRWATQWAKVTTSAVVGCNPPTNLAVNAIAATGATVTWDAAPNAVSYTLEYKTNAALAWTPIAGITTTSRNLTNLLGSTVYNVRIKTICAAASSAYAPTVNFTTLTPSCTAPNAPTIDPLTITASTAVVNWNAVVGASSYTLEYKLNAAATWSIIPNLAVTTRTLTGLAANTLYNVRIKSVCSAALTAYSPVVNFTTLAPPCTDVNEPNNSTAAAKVIAVNSMTLGSITTTGDNDYYRITTTANMTNLSIALTQLNSDFDMVLYDAAANLISFSNLSNNANEVIHFPSTTPNTYYIRIYGFANAVQQGCYRLTVLADGTPFSCPVASGANDKAPVKRIAPVNQETQIGLHLYPNPTRQAVNLDVDATLGGEYEIRFYDLLGKEVLQQTHLLTVGKNNLVVATDQLQRGVHFVRVFQGAISISDKLVIE